MKLNKSINNLKKKIIIKLSLKLKIYFQDYNNSKTIITLKNIKNYLIKWNKSSIENIFDQKREFKVELEKVNMGVMVVGMEEDLYNCEKKPKTTIREYSS